MLGVYYDRVSLIGYDRVTMIGWPFPVYRPVLCRRMLCHAVPCRRVPEYVACVDACFRWERLSRKMGQLLVVTPILMGPFRSLHYRCYYKTIDLATYQNRCHRK